MSRNIHKVFLACLNSTLTKTQLKSSLKQYHTISKIELPLLPDGRNKSIAILHLTSASEHQDIISKKNLKIRGRWVKTRPYLEGNKLKSHKKALKRRRVYIENIPFQISDQELENKLSTFGLVLGAYKIKNGCGARSKNKQQKNQYGYAEFESVAGAEKALQQKFLDFGGRGKAKLSRFQPKVKKDDSSQEKNSKLLSGGNIREESSNFDQLELESREKKPQRENLHVSHLIYLQEGQLKQGKNICKNNSYLMLKKKPTAEYYKVCENREKKIERERKFNHLEFNLRFNPGESLQRDQAYQPKFTDNYFLKGCYFLERLRRELHFNSQFGLKN